MGYISSFRQRRWIEELMDDPDGDVERLHRTLRQFRFINRVFSRVRGPLSRLVLDDMRPGRQYTLLDVGAGDGDIARWLVQSARRRGLLLHVTCCDADARVASWCQEQCADTADIRVLHARHDELAERFDYVFSNHVLHHLTDKQACEFLGHMSSIVRRRVIINDLERSALSHAAFGAFATLAFHRSFAREDGLRSLRRSYRRSELQSLLANIDWEARATIRPRFPAHMLLIGEFS